MSSTNVSSSASGAKTLPKDAQLMASILKDMGVSDHEPKVINQMLEFTYRYVTDILDDAKAYSSHANKKTVDCEDVALAVHSKMDNAFTTPPPRELVLELARSKNSQPLPLIKQGIGLRLPPDRFCFLSPNYRVKNLTSGSTPVQSAGTASVTGSSRSIPSSLQANAIQAALNAGRKNPTKSSNPGPGPTLMNKSLPRPPMNILSAPSGSNSQSSSYVSMQQQQQQAPGSMMMARPGAAPNNSGVKRKLEDD